MAARKSAEREPYREEMAEEGVTFRPVVFSCWGRPHPGATAALRSMSQSAARRGLRHGAERGCRAGVGTAPTGEDDGPEGDTFLRHLLPVGLAFGRFARRH